jgi:2-polyprenyl-6-methoxyphenol hydroxylase-like FAD-dependent oxidoreductase
MNRKRIVIFGGGIAGLTLAIQLKQSGFDPLLIERERGLQRKGYMMDFFGTGWDVAERMGLVGQLRAVRYPIDTLEFVDASRRAYMRMPIERARRALGGNYAYLRRGASLAPVAAATGHRPAVQPGAHEIRLDVLRCEIRARPP